MTWLYCQGFQSPSKLTETTAGNIIKTTEANFPLADCVCKRFRWKKYLGSLSRAEQRELLWGVAEAWLDEQRSSDRHLSFLRFTSSRCPRTQPTQPDVSWGRVSLCICVYMCVYVCPGPRYAALIKPTAKRKTRPAASSNDPEYTYGCFGENKWAENGIHKHSWYSERRGGEKLNSSRGAASQTIPLSHRGMEIFIDFQPLFLSAVMYILVLVCETTCQASQSCCRQGCWVWCCCCKGQSGSLVHQTIHQNPSPEAGTAACGPDACSDKQSALTRCKINVTEASFCMFKFIPLIQIAYNCATIHHFLKQNILIFTFVCRCYL